VYIWEQKLKKMKQALKDSTKVVFLSTKEEVQRHKQNLEEISLEIEAKKVQPEHLEKEKTCFQSYLKALHNEEREWRLNSRALWLKAGDKNTAFFHK
jgi:chromosome segregation ATPase